MSIARRITGSVVKAPEKPSHRNTTIERKHIDGGRITKASKQVLDYSEPYMELITKAQNSQQLTDPFLQFYAGNISGFGQYTPIEPIYPFNALIRIFIESTILRQCVESYVVNIESYGDVLEYIGPPEMRDAQEVADERERIVALFDNIAPDKTLTEVRMQSRWDYEVLGNRFFEVIRDTAGRIIMFDNVPGSTVRITKRDIKATTIKIRMTDPDNPKKVITRKVDRHFRRYVQINPIGQRIYFKEFGDPRIIDPKTGLVNKTLAVEDQATEIYCEMQYIPGQVYGLPRWLGTLPAILGSKEAELVNLNFFRDNAIPAMAVMVSNGALTSDSFDKLQDYFLSIKGQKSMNRIVLLEATSDDSGGSTDHSQPAPKITMQPLISERQQEGLFQGYDNNNQQKVRSSFRLPPIYVGRAEDYTRASAVASMLLAENQVFVPERAQFDFMMNAKVLTTHNINYWRFKSVGAPITDGETLISMINTMANQGALTPNAIIKLANQFLNVQFTPILEEWGDVPFQAIKAMLMNGDIIKGFDSFVIGVGKPLTEPEPGSADDLNINSGPGGSGKKSPVNPSVKKYIRKELANVIEEMKDIALQTFANNKNEVPGGGDTDDERTPIDS